jgi:hypothetical protein
MPISIDLATGYWVQPALISLEEVGCAMGYPEGKARQSVWQLLNKVDDPRVSSLRRFAKAMGIAVRDLF